MLNRAQLLLGLFLGLPCLVSPLGCAKSEESTDTPAATTGGSTGDATGGGDGGGNDGGGTGTTTGGPLCTKTPNEDFFVVFGYMGRIQGLPPNGNIDENDLHVMPPTAKFKHIALTDLQLAEEGVTCKYSCLVNDDLTRIAVATAPPGKGGYEFKYGLFNDCKEAKLNKGVKLSNVADLEFATHYLYYSTEKSCSGASCQYEIWRIDTDDPTKKELLVPFFPPPEDEDWINGDTIYNGQFTTSPDGETLVLLSPTIRSQRVYLWTKGTLHQVDYICETYQNDHCIGTGSQYRDSDPVGISPDSKTVVMFAKNDRSLLLKRYSTENPDDKRDSTFFQTQGTGDYKSLACATRKPGQFIDTLGNPKFTPDGKQLLFVGKSECVSTSQSKPETDIYAIDPSWIGDLTPVEESELFNVTKNAKGPVPTNNVVKNFTISADGQEVIFVATPHLSSSWSPLPDTDQSQFGRAEIYKVPICGGTKTQLTSNVKFQATSLRVVPIPDFSKCPTSPLAKANWPPVK